MGPHKTPLWQKHKELGAKMAEFAGWNMPISYTSILEEHHTARKSAGLFDVSHMGQIEIKGVGAPEFLNRILTCRASLAEPGQVLYTLLLNEDGGIIDDLLLYGVSANRYFLCVNASNTARDFRWISRQAENFDNITVEDISRSYGMLAIQGPNAEKILQSRVATPLSKLPYYSFTTATIEEMNVIISRTGYTGEDGFEIYCKWRETQALWDLFLSKSKSYGLKPVGLAARDTLRLEMRYPLHGSDIDEKTSPLEAGLGWAVDLNKEDDFIGRDALLRQKDEGVKRRLVGIKLTERGIPRAGYKIFSGEEEVGAFTSGAISPTLNVGVGLAYINKEHAQPGATLAIDIRGKRVSGVIINGSFVESKVKKSKSSKTPEKDMDQPVSGEEVKTETYDPEEKIEEGALNETIATAPLEPGETNKGVDG